MGVLIAYSSSAHRNLDLLPTREVPGPHGGSVRRFLRCCLLDIATEFRRVERPLDPEGPGERAAAYRQLRTGRYGVHVRTPAGQRTARVGEQGSVDHHSAQQFVLGRSLPAPDTGAFRAGARMRPTRHSSVYLPVTTSSLSGEKIERPSEAERRTGRTPLVLCCVPRGASPGDRAGREASGGIVPYGGGVAHTDIGFPWAAAGTPDHAARGRGGGAGRDVAGIAGVPPWVAVAAFGAVASPAWGMNRAA